MSYLTAWGLLESKKSDKNVKNLPNSMAFHTEKDLKSKNVIG